MEINAKCVMSVVSAMTDQEREVKQKGDFERGKKSMQRGIGTNI